MEVKKYSGKKRVIDTGTLVAEDGEISKINIKKKTEEFVIKIEFKRDDSSKFEIKINPEKEKEKNKVNITIEILNINQSFPISLTKLMPLGVFDNGEELLMYFNIRRIGGDPHLSEFNYTLYLEEKKKSGGNIHK